MALFGEFQITNSYDLSLQLESLIKSLGIGIADDFVLLETDRYFTVTKDLSDAIDLPTDLSFRDFEKVLADETIPSEAAAKSVSKLLNNNTINYDGDVETHIVTLQSTSTIKNTGKALQTNYNGMSDAISGKTFGKALTTSQGMLDVMSFIHNKYVYTEADPDFLPPQDHQGYVQLNSYYGQDYVRFEDEYSVGSRQSTFNTL
jgi:hypothetical protein